jgi:hypothetical protein
MARWRRDPPVGDLRRIEEKGPGIAGALLYSQKSGTRRSAAGFSPHLSSIDCRLTGDVRVWHKADVTVVFMDVRFRGDERTSQFHVDKSASDPERTFDLVTLLSPFGSHFSTFVSSQISVLLSLLSVARSGLKMDTYRRENRIQSLAPTL